MNCAVSFDVISDGEERFSLRLGLFADKLISSFFPLLFSFHDKDVISDVTHAVSMTENSVCLEGLLCSTYIEVCISLDSSLVNHFL